MLDTELEEATKLEDPKSKLVIPLDTAPVVSRFIKIEASEFWGPEIGGLQYFDIVRS